METTKLKTQWKALASTVIAVAVEGNYKDWTAYIGGVQGKNHDLEWKEVLKWGAKLPQNIAEILFPDFKHLKWRD
jgi:hypothetical protein